MNKLHQLMVWWFVTGNFSITIPPTACAQGSNETLGIFQTSSNLTLTWPGQITLQSAATPGGTWQDVLEAANPIGLLPTNAQQFFRAITRWSTRANLLVANSEKTRHKESYD